MSLPQACPAAFELPSTSDTGVDVALNAISSPTASEAAELSKIEGNAFWQDPNQLAPGAQLVHDYNPLYQTWCEAHILQTELPGFHPAHHKESALDASLGEQEVLCQAWPNLAAVLNVHSC